MAQSCKFLGEPNGPCVGPKRPGGVRPGMERNLQLVTSSPRERPLIQGTERRVGVALAFCNKPDNSRHHDPGKQTHLQCEGHVGVNKGIGRRDVVSRGFLDPQAICSAPLVDSVSHIPEVVAGLLEPENVMIIEPRYGLISRIKHQATSLVEKTVISLFGTPRRDRYRRLYQIADPERR